MCFFETIYSFCTSKGEFEDLEAIPEIPAILTYQMQPQIEYEEKPKLEYQQQVSNTQQEATNMSKIFYTIIPTDVLYWSFSFQVQCF